MLNFDIFGTIFRGLASVVGKPASATDERESSGPMSEAKRDATARVLSVLNAHRPALLELTALGAELTIPRDVRNQFLVMGGASALRVNHLASPGAYPRPAVNPAMLPVHEQALRAARAIKQLDALSDQLREARQIGVTLTLPAWMRTEFSVSGTLGRVILENLEAEVALFD